ncbi:hypothetical protein [Bacillus sp. KH172YL63]|uniref:hypothetical protein n=1 Tax=Bacillus sp. KH172YL63 TaxID=2709784 RepID=UPI0013E51A4C|nr:hypothetical protein [Bacillus sp. KH172YL63]BCB04125.1 hypothetical protein KH172YL63_22580 [Bacillus sp. KH172YL63]
MLKLQHKQPLLSENDISTISQAFLEANITDLEVREEHVQALKGATTPKSNCVICHKAVSDKVKAYCFDHQKNIKKLE